MRKLFHLLTLCLIIQHLISNKFEYIIAFVYRIQLLAFNNTTMCTYMTVLAGWELKHDHKPYSIPKL